MGYIHFKQKKTYLAQNPSKTVSKAAVLLRYEIGPRRDFWILDWDSSQPSFQNFGIKIVLIHSQFEALWA